MIRARSYPVVHLELHTGDLPSASDLYAELCGWRAERVVAGGGSYLALELGAARLYESAVGILVAAARGREELALLDRTRG